MLSVLKISECFLCPLYIHNDGVVVTCDDKRTNDNCIMFVGEAPGADEAIQGIPFVGRAGKLLRRTISELDINSFYITNICRCRPPNNRKPIPEEVGICGNFLLAEIASVQPYLIFALGTTATDFFTSFSNRYNNSSYSELRSLSGFNVEHPITHKNLFVSSVYHPSFILRQPYKVNEYKKSFLNALNWRQSCQLV